MYYLNPRLVNLERIFDQNERSSYLRLDLNENPGGLPKTIIDDALSEITPELVAEYPETAHFTKVLAKHIKATPQNICLTNGSAEAIRYVIEAYTGENGKIIGVVPSYFMFQVYSEMYGRNFVKVPYSDSLDMNIDDILKEMTDDAQLLILLNPNNPMGNVYSDKEVAKLIERAQEKQITVLIDEAYHYFYPKTFINYALSNKNVFVTRTFSKLFSMAGCRLGYVVGQPESVAMVQKLTTPHNTNVFALKIAEKVLTTNGTLDTLIDNFNQGRAYLINWLDLNNYKHAGSAGNFIFIQPKTDAEKLVEHMKSEKKILIKSYPNVGKLGDCLRVSIGEQKFMEQFTKALLELDK